MKVNSTLADIDFDVGELRRSNGNLIIDSDANSTIPTQIVVTPADARATIRKFLFSSNVWKFLLTLPFAGRGTSDNRSLNVTANWESRRSKRGVNKPW